MSKLHIVNRYWSIPNSILNNEELSLKAKWLFWYIQSKPDDWDFSAERIAQNHKDWIDSVMAWLKELEINWFLERIKYKNELWHWEIDYILHESSINSTWKPSLGNPDLGKALNNSNKESSNTSTSAIATVDVEKSHIKKEKLVRRINHKGSSSIRERTLLEPFVPPEKEVFIELLWDTNWVSKYHEFFSIWKIYQSFTNEQLKELYLWMIDFFKEKSNWKIYRGEDWRMVGSKIILDELDKMIAYYSSKWNDILDLKATLRWWIVRNSEPYPFTKK